MELTADEYWRLAKIYPQSDFERDGESPMGAIQRQKRAMRLHLGRERYGNIKPLWDALLQIRKAGFSLEDAAHILETDIDTVEDEWKWLREFAR